ncbi:MAG: ketopantoate reductase family protein [Gemmatimonadetes bacterium]|jgi:2-dehydropantoate 2-reductase|nr:ketopantoate reductase family protein [Gemmatimonadota bacterium]
MQIVIVGAGNMGCLYGANLARVGARVTLVDPWKEHVDQMRLHGLRMHGLHGEFTASVQAMSDPPAAPKADMVIILVNAYATREAAESCRVLLKDDGFALTLQNGLGNVEVLHEALGQDRVLPGLSFHSADLTAPGAVQHTNEGPTYLGEMDGSRSPRLIELHRLMKQADMQPVLEADIMSTIWGKFVHNCAINAVCASADLRPGHLKDVAALDEFQTHIIEETLALVAARGVRIPSNTPLQDVKQYCASKFHRVSMLQHLARGRRTEIDALNGYVVTESRKLGLSCPYSESLTALIKGREYVPAAHEDA